MLRPEISNTPNAGWTALPALRSRFDANLKSMRDANLAGDLRQFRTERRYFLSAAGGHIRLGVMGGDGVVASLDHPVPSCTARETLQKLFPEGVATQSVLIAGLDQGWLWDGLYKLPRPGGNTSPVPTIYLAAGSLEQLWVVLHLQNWGRMLADARVRIVVGREAMSQLRREIAGDSRLRKPSLSITVEDSLWAEYGGFEQWSNLLQADIDLRYAQTLEKLSRWNQSIDLSQLARKLETGPLRILGITSRFTTFLQHSMRDWLEALRELGQETSLLIEEADHEGLTSLTFAERCAEFGPDVILMIDHCRGEYRGLPGNVPFVMWVQDRLPNIYRKEAGAMQKRLDYAVGYGMQECVKKHGYPASRFMPAMVGVNPKRFAVEIKKSDLEKYACDVSFVTHASATPEEILQQECEKEASSEGRALLNDLYEQLKSVYDRGEFVSQSVAMQKMIDSSLIRLKLSCDTQPLLDVLTQRLNNAFFRHQAIGWVAEAGLDLRLYGNGWGRHPRFAKFARGVANNQTELAAIFRASLINLQVTPFGAAHQRLFEGLAAGGFFLLRSVVGDFADQVRQQLWSWAQLRAIKTSAQLNQQLDADARAWIERLYAMDCHADSEIEALWAEIEETAGAEFSRSAGTLWPQFAAVAFSTRSELHERMAHFLANAGEREEISEQMRRVAVEHHSYAAISRRMLRMIADDLPAATTLAQAA